MRICIVMLGLALGCATAPVHPGFRDSWDDFRTRVHTICSDGVFADFELPDQNPKLRRLEAFIARAMREGGLTLIPAQRVREVERRVAEDFGGVYDVHTGRAIESRQTGLARATRGALREAFGCDARLRAEVRRVTASMVATVGGYSGAAAWDGHRARLSEAIPHFGPIAAISVSIEILEVDDGALYFRAAGVQLASDLVIGDSWFEITPLDPQGFLADPERTMAAVVRALGPLAGNRAGVIDDCVKAAAFSKVPPAKRRPRCERQAVGDLLAEVADAPED